MELPKFKYNPNAYKLDLFKEIEGLCSICNQRRNLKYTASFYSVDTPEYICPWCIANGEASKKYDGEFNGYYGIEGVSPNLYDPRPTIAEELLLELTNKTLSYNSWQEEVWLTHCNEPCAFIDYADAKTIEPYLDELKDDINEITQGNPMTINYLTKKGSFAGYLFKCVKCGTHRLHADFD